MKINSDSEEKRIHLTQSSRSLCKILMLIHFYLKFLKPKIRNSELNLEKVKINGLEKESEILIHQRSQFQDLFISNKMLEQNSK
jgi:hypothetical protein